MSPPYVPLKYGNNNRNTGILGLICPLRHVVLGPAVSKNDTDVRDVGPGALFRRKAELEHVTQRGARHGASPHVLHPRHGLPDGPRRGVLAQGELCAHLGGVLDEADAGARPGNVQRLHDADDKLLDQLKVGRAHALGAVDHKNQVQDSVAASCLCKKRKKKRF